jgi:hypothetical protein
MEGMYGHTPDISMFRFAFWEPVWYYEPTAKYPKPNFLPGRFVGIAWNHGDAFTYKIWTTPNNDWEQGLELIRNVVHGRQHEDCTPRAAYTESDLALTKKKPSKKQRARNKKQTQIDGAPDLVGGDAPNERLVSFADESGAPLFHTAGIDSDTEPEEQREFAAEEEAMETAIDVNSATAMETCEDGEVVSANSAKRPCDEDAAPTIEYNPLDEDNIEMVDEANDFLSSESP